MKFLQNKGLATRILFGFTVAGAMIMSNLSLVVAAPTTEAQSKAYYPTTETVAKVTSVSKMMNEQKTVATAQTRRAQQTANTAEQLAYQKQQAEIAKKEAEEAKKIAAAKKAAAEKLAAQKAAEAKAKADAEAKKVAAEQAAKAEAEKVAAQKATTEQATQTATTNKTIATNTSTATTAGGSEASAKAAIAARESGGNYGARNGQYVGKYQLTDSYLHGDYSAANQERVANSYVSSRYGSWSNALAHWNANGWY